MQLLRLVEADRDARSVGADHIAGDIERVRRLEDGIADRDRPHRTVGGDAGQVRTIELQPHDIGVVGAGEFVAANGPGRLVVERAQVDIGLRIEHDPEHIGTMKNRARNSGLERERQFQICAVAGQARRRQRRPECCAAARHVAQLLQAVCRSRCAWRGRRQPGLLRRRRGQAAAAGGAGCWPACAAGADTCAACATGGGAGAVRAASSGSDSLRNGGGAGCGAGAGAALPQLAAVQVVALAAGAACATGGGAGCGAAAGTACATGRAGELGAALDCRGGRDCDRRCGRCRRHRRRSALDRLRAARHRGMDSPRQRLRGSACLHSPISPAASLPAPRPAQSPPSGFTTSTT